MKTKSFMAALMLVGTMAFASGPGPRVVVVSNKNSGMFKVIYEAEKVGDVKMSILNQKGEVLFSETTRNVDGFARPVNFSGMTPGEYTIEISDASGKQIQKVQYAMETSVKNVHVAKISEEGKYLLSVANDGIEQINVRIFDGSNNLVHNEDMIIKGDFGLVYNLKGVSGIPTFEVTDKTGNIRAIK